MKIFAVSTNPALLFSIRFCGPFVFVTAAWFFVLNWIKAKQNRIVSDAAFKYRLMMRMNIYSEHLLSYNIVCYTFVQKLLSK